ncbi:hypothetical protein INT46_005245 [Mucor plumbeus]|uniref:Uncharacterized protein n=1 Tax=Mucor plumbeus TaxID=97098 RepID=A0A8H7RNJ0_9FUNG|nr:hypothetical protein INT46_005245 [Mucor plumbeus]
MPSSFTSKIGRMRSVKLPFKKSSSSNTSSTSSTPSPSSPPLQSQSREPNFYNTPEPTVVTTPFNSMPQSSFAETLQVISKEANRTQFDDIFDSFFFNDKRCQHRALFMAARLKQTLDGVINPIRPSSNYGPLRELPPVTLTPSYSTPITSSTTSSPSNNTNATSPAITNNTTTKPIASVDSFWRTVTHRLYTLNYILFVLPADSQSRAQFLNKIETDLSQKSDGRELQRRGGMEAHFAVRYALEHKRPRRRKTLLEDAFAAEKRNGGSVAGAILPPTSTTTSDDIQKIDRLVEQARLVIEQCLESETKLGHAEKDAMYVFHGMRAGLHGAFDLHIELEEDRSLRHRLKRTVDHNREMAKPAYENPFEDEDLVVTEEDESSVEELKKPSREVDSGFYDGWANNNAMLSA